MIVTTTNSVEGYQIAEYKGIVVGEAIMGANVVRDVFASITDIVGGRSGAYESKLQDARETALSRTGGARPVQGRQCRGRCRSRL